jgi:hypothetical protein
MSIVGVTYSELPCNTSGLPRFVLPDCCLVNLLSDCVEVSDLQCATIVFISSCPFVASGLPIRPYPWLKHLNFPHYLSYFEIHNHYRKCVCMYVYIKTEREYTPLLCAGL